MIESQKLATKDVEKANVCEHDRAMRARACTLFFFFSRGVNGWRGQVTRFLFIDTIWQKQTTTRIFLILKPKNFTCRIRERGGQIEVVVVGEKRETIRYGSARLLCFLYIYIALERYRYGPCICVSRVPSSWRLFPSAKPPPYYVSPSIHPSISFSTATSIPPITTTFLFMSMSTHNSPYRVLYTASRIAREVGDSIGRGDSKERERERESGGTPKRKNSCIYMRYLLESIH